MTGENPSAGENASGPARNPGQAKPCLADLRIEILFLLLSPRSCTLGDLLALLRNGSFWALMAITLSPLPFLLADYDGSAQALRSILMQIETALAVLLIVPTLLLFAVSGRHRGGALKLRFIFPHVVLTLAAVMIGLMMQRAAGLPVTTDSIALRLVWLLVVSKLATAIVFDVIMPAPAPSVDTTRPAGPVIAPVPASPPPPPGPPPLPEADQLIYAVGIGGADLRIETRLGPVFRFQSFSDFAATTDPEGGILVRRALWMFNGGLAALEREGADLFVVAVDGSRHKVGRTRRTAVRLWAKSLLQGD